MEGYSAFCLYLLQALIMKSLLRNKTFASGLVLAAALGIVALFSFGFRSEKTPNYHSADDMKMFQAAAAMDLPLGANELFTGSGKCAGCHGHDPTEYAGFTSGAWDVNVTDFWRSTIMANSAKDPLWRAKVSHEVAVNPDHQLQLENKCTSCHAPLGNFNHQFNGEDHYTMAMLVSDSLGLDGVSCVACHQQSPRNIGSAFSGELTFVEDTVFGPYGGPEDDIPLFGQPMTSFVGYEPLYSAHITESETCAGCHTLITETADLEGNLTGGKYVEQATYHEWLNSVYADNSDPMAQECQGCHMPRIDEGVVISSNYIFLQPRSPYSLHTQVGANTFMLTMFKNNIDELGLAATEAQFDSTIAYTMDMLQNQSVDLSLEEEYYEDDTLAFKVTLLNKAGHKFPSGYPARRAFIEFVATDDQGNELMRSGVLQPDYEVEGQDEIYEPHYDVITSNDQVQIYEQVVSDVEGNPTTVLERMDHLIKDNRLAPIGFSSNHEVYDTTLVAGLALEDENWNRIDGVEGSGSDEVTYKFALNGYEGTVNVSAKLYYQSVPPKWLNEMFSYDTPEIEWFRNKYEEQGAAPVLVQEQSVTSVVDLVQNKALSDIKIYPNPSTQGFVNIQSKDTRITGVSVYDMTGQLISYSPLNGVFFRVDLPSAAGTYIVVIDTPQGQKVERILRW